MTGEEQVRDRRSVRVPRGKDCVSMVVGQEGRRGHLPPWLSSEDG